SFAQDAPDDAPTASGTQFLVLGNAEGRGGAANGSSFIVRNDAASASIFLGSSSKPVALNVDGPGFVIRCGQASSGGAAIEYEFIPSEPATAGPDPRSEAAVRRLSQEFARGEPDYDLMTLCMAQTARAQLDSLTRRFRSLGAITAVTRNENRSAPGIDAYDVEYVNGSLTWVVALTQDGKVKLWTFHES